MKDTEPAQVSLLSNSDEGTHADRPQYRLYDQRHETSVEPAQTNTSRNLLGSDILP